MEAKHRRIQKKIIKGELPLVKVEVDTPLYADDLHGTTILDTWLSNDKLPEEEVLIQQTVKLVKSAMGCLSDRERYVICRRFGVIGDPATLEAIGRELRPPVTREFVRLLEKRAKEKLKEELSIYRRALSVA